MQNSESTKLLSYYSLCPLVSQVEFYLSDSNLPTDKKLLRQIRKDAEGFGERFLAVAGDVTDATAKLCTQLTLSKIARPGSQNLNMCLTPLSLRASVPLRLFANFRKIRALTKDTDVIARALESSKVRDCSTMDSMLNAFSRSQT